MAKGIRVKAWGDYALFSRPEMKVERCSCEIMTPSAARGILEAIYWHAGKKWVIDRISCISVQRRILYREILFCSEMWNMLSMPILKLRQRWLMH